MANPKIGVVVPTWNSAKFLDWTLLSLRKQLDCDVEIVVSDSGSTDATLDICKRWDVPSVYEPPGSMYRAINRGMKELTAPWLTYLNSDDITYPDGYSRLIAQGESTGADLVYGDCDFMDEVGRFLFPFKAAKPELLKDLVRHGTMPFGQPCIIWRRDVYKEIGDFRPDFRHISDYEFFIRTVRAGKKFSHLDGPAVCAFRILSNQLHQKEKDIVAKETAILQESGLLEKRKPFQVLRWRSTNLFNYLIRYLRKGSLRTH